LRVNNDASDDVNDYVGANNVMLQTMMQAMGDSGVYDITSPSNDESHKEQPWACLNTACESPSLFPWHLISSRLVPKYIR
jgi:hypothetical protein